MKTLLAVLVSALLVIGVAPVSAAAAPDTQLEGTTRRLHRIAKVPFISDMGNVWRTRGQELRIADGRISVDTGCNRGRGKVHVLEETPELGPLATTLIGCERRAAKIEKLILKVLVDGAKWRIKDDRLRISIIIGNYDYRLQYRAA
ncbi:META domain-containing protein [Nocardioides sp. B-3]|uniref:META domain-containing protein n=1 Tax=Nocardioides sp. B-3 TaxID=2895565 RepID=UPI0021532F40|nr:META domain-containing protein [Nocardioides sp. B-3]UUZ58077.1 META domain-containing protein [Nocardioides sp. B-3]